MAAAVAAAAPAAAAAAVVVEQSSSSLLSSSSSSLLLVPSPGFSYNFWGGKRQRKNWPITPPTACLFSYAAAKNSNIGLQLPPFPCSKMPLFLLLISRSVFHLLDSLLA